MAKLQSIITFFTKEKPMTIEKVFGTADTTKIFKTFSDEEIHEKIEDFVNDKYNAEMDKDTGWLD